MMMKSIDNSDAPSKTESNTESVSGESSSSECVLEIEARIMKMAQEKNAPTADLEAGGVKEKKDDVKAEIASYVLNSKLNSTGEVEKQVEKLSVIKSSIPFGKLFYLGFAAGWWLGLASILSIVIAGGVPADIRQTWPMLPRILTGFLFPTGVCFIILFGGELFTGNSMVMLIGLYAGRISIFHVLYNWSVVLVSNFAGCVTTVYMFASLTNLLTDEPWRSYVTGMAEMKINMAPEVAFLRAIAANALVCTSILLGFSARDMSGKLIALWFPLLTFCASGYEHAIMNMAYIPLGLMYGANADYKLWLYRNLLVVILGNIVGGGFIIGGTYYFLNDWTKVLKKMQTQTVPAKKEAKNEALIQVLCARPHVHVAPPTYEPAPTRQTKPDINEQRVKTLFHDLDGDRDGAINSSQVVFGLQNLGYLFPAALVDGMIKSHAAFEGKDLLQWDGFVALVRCLHNMQQLGLQAF